MKPAPVKADVSFEQLQQLDIRVGTISRVEDIAESRKLVKLTVDFGDHSRSILVGMKQERDDPGEVEGSQALFLLNLPEKTMAGQLSQGMLLDAGYEDGIKPCLLMPERQIPNGTRAG
jgi:tRNA-binding protein